MQQINSRIKQKYDILSNWSQHNIVLLNGELAVVDCGNQIKFKVGNGLSTFNQLPFIDQEVLSTKWMTANAVSQGIHAKAVPFGLATGAYLCANANFSQALGFDAQTLSSDTYSFVWNGDDTRAIGDYYESHGKGTFNINALSGLSGIFIGEQSLVEVLDTKGGNKITIDDRISGICQQSDLSVVKLCADEYYQLVSSGNALSNCLYVIQNQFSNMYGQQIKNVAIPTDLSDVTNKEYVDSAISSNLNNFYRKSETSSSIEISTAFASIDTGNKIFIDDKISNISGYSDLSVVKLGVDEYASLLTSNTLLSNCLYVVEDEYIDAYGQQIKNIASPTNLSDATTKEYVDNAIPVDLSAFTNSPGYLTAHQSLSSYYQKSETSSASEISTALTSIDVGNKVFIDDRISGIVEQTDLSIVHLSSSEYEQLCANGQILSNALYIVEDFFTNNYGKQIKNVAEPTLSNDAATKGYVDDAISNIEIPTDLSAFTNSPGYLLSDDLSDSFDDLEETLSAINGGNVQMAGVNLLSYISAIVTNNAFPLNIATNVYRLTAPITSGDATIPEPDRQLVPQSNQYYYFEMEVAIDSSATSLTGPSGWTWVAGGELPASGYAGKTLYVSVRLDCQTGDYLANVWRLA